MERSAIIGALGPTNTGKTHRAIERMLEHESGMIGLPLRLLAREVFDKVLKRTEPEAVALITGEEKLVPQRPRYWVCTVEAMPMDRDVDFLAVDEIQLAGHHERGHIFTDRLLHARGRRETWFMGSDTMTTLAQRLVPTIQLRRFPRLSALSSEGSFTLGTLPRRSAVVAFSARNVYELAEKLRARKGGVAIVLGGLSPRARNAQVAMYQAGEVDYLVATDAIGMGLNLDIDRVAFADTRKFDGREWRDLEVSELAQIAGRAGRHTKNGAFGTFARTPLPAGAVHAIETHRFPQQRRLIWRRSDLDFSSPDSLLRSLEEQPKVRVLELVGDPEDTRTLRKLLNRSEVRSQLGQESDLQLLWELCQIPDYRQLLVDEHARLVGEIFEKIRRHGKVPADDVHQRLDRLARHTGDIDMITSRISFVRTWNYVANHDAWVEHASALAARTRQLEDTLSDDLHQTLLERFVDRRKVTSLSRHRASASNNERKSGSLLDQLSALHAEMVAEPSSQDRLEEALTTPAEEWELTPEGIVRQQALILGELVAGQSILEPNVHVASEISGTALADRAHQLLRQIVQQKLRHALGPLVQDPTTETSSALRGITYQLRSGLGQTRKSPLQPLLRQLSPGEQTFLNRAGIKIGLRHVYCAPLLKPKMILQRCAFARAFFIPRGDPTRAAHARFESPLNQPSLAGRPSLISGPLQQELWSAIGYSSVSEIAIRLDVLDGLLRQRKRHTEEEWTRIVAHRTGQKLPIARRIAPLLTPRKQRRSSPRAL